MPGFVLFWIVKIIINQIKKLYLLLSINVYRTFKNYNQIKKKN